MQETVNHGIVALEERLAGAARDDASAGEDVDLVRRCVRMPNLVREDHDAEVVFRLQCMQCLVEVVRGLRVQSERRLVEQKKTRAECQRAREGDAPLSGSPQLHRHGAVVDVDADLGKQLPRRVAGLGSRAVLVLQKWQLDILEDADPPEERGALEKDPDPRAQLPEGLLVRLGGVERLTVDGDCPGLGTLEPDEMPHEHGLTGLDRTENEQRLSASDEEVDVENEWRARRTGEVMNLERALRGRERG